MKTTRTLRLLSLLGFLLLLAPFYDHCYGHMMKEVVAVDAVATDTTSIEVDSTVIDTTEIDQMEIDTLSVDTEGEGTSIIEKAYEFIDDDDSENAYEIALLNKEYFKMTFDEFATGMKEGIAKKEYGGFFFILKNTCFAFIIIITIFIFLSSFNNSKRVHKLSRVNLVLLLITVVSLFLEGLFETITQIKWGYYAFIVTNFLIFYYSKLALKQKKP
jgi:hypothetical protein